MAKTKYCPCGQQISVDYRWNGLAYHPVFYNPETGDEIAHCPGCGESATAWPDALLDEPPIDANFCEICGN